MKLQASKIIPAIVLGPVLVFYTAAIIGHLFMEFSFSQSTLHTQQSALSLIPGTYMVDDEDLLFCVDDAVEGRAIGPGMWSEGYCETDPAQRITVFSRYMRKTWVLYINPEREVVFKRSWTVL